MTFVVRDRVRDTSTSTGTGVITVSGTAASTYRSFDAVSSTNDLIPYLIVHQSANEWELGIATKNASNQLTRTDAGVFDGSAGVGARVNFSAGTKDVILNAPARYIFGGKRLLIPTVTLGTVGSADIVLPDLTNYSCVEIQLEGFSPATGGSDLQMRVSTDGGATYIATAGAYKYAALRYQDTADVTNQRSSGATAITLQTALGNNGAEGAYGTIQLWDPKNTGRPPRITWDLNAGFQGGLTDCFGTRGFAKRTASEDTDAVRLLFSAGNVLSGSIYRVYGWVK